ncbi:MAG: hypothetical protein GY827_12125 [Cytophagales bacterium]|nr:hypothetical protein [Cytophagales bacterium]
MKKLILLLSLFFSFTFSYAQKVEVVSLDQKVQKIPHRGLATYIELDKKDVEKLWKKQLKQYGKLEKEKGVYYVNVASINSISSTPVRVISKVEKTSQGTMVWLAIDNGTTHIKKGVSGYDDMKELLKEFGITAYRDDVMKQIKEAEKAHAKALKNQEKMLKKAASLQKALARNDEEKTRLENALVENANKKKELEGDVAQNEADQEAAAENVQTMNEALEAVKDKLNHIE